MSAELISALIWTCMLGLSAGNGATSFVYRMPKGESPFARYPYCGGCNTMLGAKDLFPALSWLLLKGKCRYCGMPIPAVYFWVEIFSALVFMLGVASYGFSEAYILVAITGLVAVTFWGLEVRSGKLWYSLLLTLGALGIIYRTLLDGTLYNAIYGAVLGAGIPLVYWRMKADPDNLNGAKAPLRIPASAALGAVAGLWFGPFGFIVFILLWLPFIMVTRLIHRSHPVTAPLTSPYLLAFSCLMLWPDIITTAQQYTVAFLRDIFA